MTKDTRKNLQNKIIKVKKSIENTQKYVDSLYNQELISYTEASETFDYLSEAQAKILSALDKL